MTLQASENELSSETGRNIYAITADMGDLESIQELVEKAAEAMGGIDILINNGARVSGGEPEDFNEVSDELILKDFQEKFLGYFRCTRAVVPI